MAGSHKHVYLRSQFWRHFTDDLVCAKLRRYHGRTCVEIRRPYLPHLQAVRARSPPAQRGAGPPANVPAGTARAPVRRPPRSAPCGMHRRRQGSTCWGARLAGRVRAQVCGDPAHAGLVHKLLLRSAQLPEDRHGSARLETGARRQIHAYYVCLLLLPPAHNSAPVATPDGSICQTLINPHPHAACSAATPGATGVAAAMCIMQTSTDRSPSSYRQGQAWSLAGRCRCL